jgi:CRP-like cAMP-binding protein
VKSPSSDEKRKLLASVPLFAGLGPRELDALVPAARSVRFAAREEVFHKGDAGAQLFVVIRGRLKAFTTSQEGDDVVFSLMGPGEVFGEVAVLGECRRTATVKAIDACDLLALDRRDFLAFLRKSPDASIVLLGVLANRLRNVSELVEDTQFLNLPLRLAKKFTQFLNLPLRLAKKFTACARMYGEPHDGGVRINLRLSQEEWGDLVGATRESVNKQMRAWSEGGVIRVEGGCVLLLRPEEIERIARLTID